MNADRMKIWSSISNQPANYYVNASESERQAWRTWVRGLLQEYQITVDFEKTDGSFRSMKCTLREDLGAKYAVTGNKKPKTPNPEVCVVWDCDQRAWRSFRWTHLKRLSFTLE